MQNSQAQDLTPDERRTLNRVAREESKLKLLADIRTDLMICEIEGWDKKEYIKEIQELINGFQV